MAKGTVTIDVNRCKGCSLCIDACPQSVLVLDDNLFNARGYHPVSYRDPDSKCTGCALCAVNCPDVCFTVYRFSKSTLGATAHAIT